MARHGERWISRANKRSWEVTEVRNDVVTLRSDDGSVVTLPESELSEGWFQPSGGTADFAKIIHSAMVWALRDTNSSDPNYYETLTARLREQLALADLPEWMTADFWSVEADPNLPKFKAHRIIPTVLLGKPVVFTIQHEPSPAYTAALNDTFIRADNPVAAIAGLARLIKSRGN